METIELTKDQLQAALLQWEQQARAGEWERTPELPAEQVAAECADHLWGLLTASVQA